MVVAPRMSGSTAGTLAGGGGEGLPRMRDMIHAPRFTGDVVVPLAVTLSTLARFQSIDAVMEWAARTKVPRVQPRFLKRGDETLICFPGDPLYPPVEGFETPDHTRFTLKDRRWRPVRPD